MRKSGVIRPRSFEAPLLDDNAKEPRGLKRVEKRKLLIAACAFVALVFLVVYGAGSGGQEVAPSAGLSTPDPDAPGLRSARAGFEEEEDDEEGARPSTFEDLGGAGRGRQRSDDEDEDEGDPEEEEGNESDDSLASEDTHQAEAEIDEEGDEAKSEGGDGDSEGSQGPGEIESAPSSENPTKDLDSIGSYKALLAKGPLHNIGPSRSDITIDDFFGSLGHKAVRIASSGSFKFVILKVTDQTGGGAYMVQGCSPKSSTCKHPDAAKIARTDLKRAHLESEILGGGRITHHRLKKPISHKGVISIFGYSRTYGRCIDCNRKVCAFVAAAFPEHVVRWSNQGYHESDEHSIRDFAKCSE